MRYASLLLILALATFVGCERTAEMPGPTVKKFNGKLEAGGKPVQFNADDQVVLDLIHGGSGRKFGVPIKADGTFDVGQMPIGKYSGIMKITKSSAKEKSKGAGVPTMTSIPDGFEIKEGQTEYVVNLGANFKP
ncbi:MAG: hypothetical protein ACRC8S_16725 [Fimbriiglobus sp.]